MCSSIVLHCKDKTKRLIETTIMQSTLLQKSLNGLEPFSKEHPLLVTGCIQTKIVIIMHIYSNHQRDLFMLKGEQGMWHVAKEFE